MSLTAKDVAEIMRLLDESSFDALELESGDLKLSLRRGSDGAADIPSPLLGVFYRAPKPGEAPFVEVGSVVEEDTVIAIIEVMKLMNSVRAGVKGEVVEILAENGALVEYGEPLMRVRPA